MQHHRSDDYELPPCGANPSPPISHVHGLGESHALRVDLQPVQLPWLADEIDTLRSCIADELARERADYDALPAKSNRRPWSDASAELDRRSYQLRVLAMIREQLPVSRPVAAACVASPWHDSSELTWELARVTAPVTVVGPARGMLVLIAGASRNVADALGEGLRGPEPKGSEEAGGPRTVVSLDFRGLTGGVANRLRDLAAAAAAFTDTYVTALAQQSYSFDPEHYPLHSDELW